MSAAAERLALAEIGRSLVALAGERGERRARALTQRNPLPRAASLADIARAPGWLLQPREALVLLAVTAALVAMAPALAESIDGGWLRELAEKAGDETLDHAMSLAPFMSHNSADAISADKTEPFGFDLMRAALPLPLRPYVAWAATGSTNPPADLARFSIEAADRFLRGAHE